MSRIGSTIKSAYKNAITPPKLLPPFHRTVANGTLPTEHTNEMIATKGPTSGPQNFASKGWDVKKKALQKLLGTHAAIAPARSRPPAISFQTETQSMTK